ncbi:hypothetical protein EGW08_006203 [Elysia chlorotica]|uniref:Fibrinogen C-terminal domain-containing protein n=1 Tax=Elysia chlorotica TaxID=188477 RepID=A0A3S0ZYA7_ELYCH|nr:hypothetical protein EGW08_006203 [Elysia chlorotica]
MWEFESKINSPSRDFSQSKPVDILHNNKTLLEFLESTRRLEHILEDKTDLLSSLATSNTKTQTCEKIYQFITENLTADINEISNGSQALNRVVEDQMIEINDSFNTFLQSLEESINSSLSMTPSFPPKLVSAPGNLGGDIITESPKVCKKNEGLKYKGEKYVEIEPVEDGLLQVPYLCDMISDGGGWIVIQHRATGDTDFFLGWEDYKEGFGSLDTDFWLGNDNIHALTSSGSWELNVEVKYKGDTREANYKDFSLGDEDSNYKLHIGTYSGTAGDSLSRHDGHPFTTKDKDNDESDSRNCASTFEGAWWYINCHDSNLNGKWMSITAHHGLMWRTLTDSKSATFSEMKIRQVAP